tara:strand:+ start:288 stop:602 length:315 start_codon:yes stop_codon:yes gene_type:complete
MNRLGDIIVDLHQKHMQKVAVNSQYKRAQELVGTMYPEVSDLYIDQILLRGNTANAFLRTTKNTLNSANSGMGDLIVDDLVCNGRNLTGPQVRSVTNRLNSYKL